MPPFKFKPEPVIDRPNISPRVENNSPHENPPEDFLSNRADLREVYDVLGKDKKLKELHFTTPDPKSALDDFILDRDSCVVISPQGVFYGDNSYYEGIGMPLRGRGHIVLPSGIKSSLNRVQFSILPEESQKDYIKVRDYGSDEVYALRSSVVSGGVPQDLDFLSTESFRKMTGIGDDFFEEEFDRYCSFCSRFMFDNTISPEDTLSPATIKACSLDDRIKFIRENEEYFQKLKIDIINSFTSAIGNTAYGGRAINLDSDGEISVFMRSPSSRFIGEILCSAKQTAEMQGSFITNISYIAE